MYKGLTTSEGAFAAAITALAALKDVPTKTMAIVAVVIVVFMVCNTYKDTHKVA